MKVNHSPELEASIIGCIIKNNEVFSLVNPIISKDDFAGVVHQKIYEVLSSILQEGGGADKQTLKNSAVSLNRISDIGGTEYIETVTKHASHPKVIVNQAKLLKRYSSLRKIDGITSQYNAIVSSGEYEGQVEELTYEIINKCSSVLTDTSDSFGFNDYNDKILSLQEGRVGRLIETGLECIDESYPLMTGGLTLVAARPSQGKSAFCVELALRAAQKGNRVDFYSLEMSSEQILARMLTSMAMREGREIAYSDFYNPRLRHKLREDDLSVLNEIAQELPEINFNDSSSMTTTDIIHNSMINKTIKDKPEIVFVDYLNNLSLKDQKGERLDVQIGMVAKQLRAFAKKHDVAVVLVCQLNRTASEANSGRPSLAALKNSGDLEQDADTVLLVYKKSKFLEYKTPVDDMVGDIQQEYFDCEREIEIICAKQRMGPTGSAKLHCSMKANWFECK